MFTLNLHQPEPKQIENLRLERILDPNGLIGGGAT